MIFTIVALFLLATLKNYRSESGTPFRVVAANGIADWAKENLLQVYTPLFSIYDKEHGGVVGSVANTQAGQIFPLYTYARESDIQEVHTQDKLTIEMILLEEEQRLAQESINANASNDGGIQEGLPEIDEAAMLEGISQDGTPMQETVASPFVPRQKVNAIDLSLYSDYDMLVKNFYTIDSSTMIGSEQLNAQRLSSMDMKIQKQENVPQILIFHTHYHETFKDSVAGDKSTSIVGVGEKLATILREEYGYEVIHYTGEYDQQAGPDAYSGALPILEEILRENPSIEVVLDLHRDAAGENDHLMVELDGKPTAQFMFFNGLSRTKKSGNIAYLQNDNLDSTLAFSFQMQVKSMEYYPGLTRKIYLKSYRYNLHLSPRSSLVEIGAQNNTVEEVMNACYPLAHVLDLVLSGEQP
ncbi:MAG: stage II sporulation protein P [Clostridium sp.]|nr:stage II sporulation protein P [Clostridium sp.]